MIVVSYSLPVDPSLLFGDRALLIILLSYLCAVIKDMQKLILLSLFCVACLAVPQPQMTDAQLEQTLADHSTMQRHLKCATGEGPCDPVGRRLRILAPLVLRGACPQCSAQETRQIRRTLAHIQRNYPWEWAKIVRQYG